MLCNSEQLERYWSCLGWGTQTCITNSLPKMQGHFPGQPVPVYHIGGAAVAYLSHSSSPLLLCADSCNSCKVVLGRASEEEEEGAKCALWNTVELVLAGSSLCYAGLDGAGELPFPHQDLCCQVRLRNSISSCQVGWPRHELLAAVRNLLAQNQCDAVPSYSREKAGEERTS